MTFCKKTVSKVIQRTSNGKNSTDQRNRFQMIYFDFSKGGVSLKDWKNVLRLIAMLSSTCS